MNAIDSSPYALWKDWSADDFGHCDVATARYFELESALPRGARVLEVGFGNGQFLAWARSRGAEAWGVELDPALVERARRRFGATSAWGDLHDPAVDALLGTLSHVVAFDVLEHVPQEQIPAFLARMAALLAPGGRILLRFPNGDSPFGRIHQHGDPTHVTTLGRGKLDYFARGAGLELLAWRATALPLRGMGMMTALRRLLVLAGRGLVERLFATLYFGGQRLPLDPNCIAVLARRTDRPVR